MSLKYLNNLNYLYQEKPTKDADMIRHITFTYQQLEVLILQLLVSKSIFFESTSCLQVNRLE